MGLEPTPLYQCMTFALMQAGVEGDEEMTFEASTCGDLARVRLCNSSGEVVMTVFGKSHDELGEQFALGCLHRVSINRLRQLHQTPLQDTQPVMNRVK